MSKSWFVSCEFYIGQSCETAVSPRLDSTEKVLDAVRRMLALDGVIEITSETDPTSTPVAIIAEEVQRGN